MKVITMRVCFVLVFSCLAFPSLPVSRSRQEVTRKESVKLGMFTGLLDGFAIQTNVVYPK